VQDTTIRSTPWRRQHERIDDYHCWCDTDRYCQSITRMISPGSMKIISRSWPAPQSLCRLGSHFWPPDSSLSWATMPPSNRRNYHLYRVNTRTFYKCCRDETEGWTSLRSVQLEGCRIDLLKHLGIGTGVLAPFVVLADLSIYIRNAKISIWDGHASMPANAMLTTYQDRIDPLSTIRVTAANRLLHS